MEKFIFHPRKCQNTWKNFELDVDQMFLVILCMVDTMRGAADTMHGSTNMMRVAAGVMHVR